MPKSFSVNRRNPGHWDICADGIRVYRVRGAPGEVALMSEGQPYTTQHFRTVAAAMARVVDEFMFEHIIAEGDLPTVVESWNRSEGTRNNG